MCLDMKYCRFIFIDLLFILLLFLWIHFEYSIETERVKFIDTKTSIIINKAIRYHGIQPEDVFVERIYYFYRTNKHGIKQKCELYRYLTTKD